MKEMSKKNPYYISKNRKWELKYFCKQYREWKKALNDISFFTIPPEVKVTTSDLNSMAEKVAEKRDYYNERIGLIETCAKEANPDISKWIILAVTEDKNYESLRMVYNIPCHRAVYYTSLQRFFYILDKKR